LRRVGGSGEAVAAIDATFSAPKSVSAVWALARPELRERIERRARDRDRPRARLRGPAGADAPPARQTGHGRARQGDGVVATSWRHTTARAVEPIRSRTRSCTRTSCCTPRTVRRRADRGDRLADVAVHQREVGAAYRTELARELATLGFAVERGTGRGDGTSSSPASRSRCWTAGQAATTRSRPRSATGSPTKRDLRAVIAEGGPAAADAATSSSSCCSQTGQLAPAEERMMGTITRTGKTPLTVGRPRRGVATHRAGLGASRERVEVLRHQHANR
jgi:hypothetical protein